MSQELRNTFDNILREWGHNILLQRILNPFDPWDNREYGETFEKHTVRRVFPGSRALGNVQTEEIEGLLYDHEFVYYFRHDVDPISGDLIYEQEILESRNVIKQDVFRIDLAIPMRGVGGHIVYWAAGVDRDDTRIIPRSTQ